MNHTSPWDGQRIAVENKTSRNCLRRRPPTSPWDGQRAIVTHPRLHGTGNAKSCDRHETTSQCIQCDAFCSAGGPTGGKELRENSKEMSSLLSTRLLKASSERVCLRLFGIELFCQYHKRCLSLEQTTNESHISMGRATHRR